MGSSRKHRENREKDKERDTKEKQRSRSKSKERSDKTNYRSTHRHRDKDRDRDKELTTGSRKRSKPDSSDDERTDRRADKKLKVKEVKDVSKTSNSSVNKTVKLDQKSSEESDRTDRKDGQQNKEDFIRSEGSNTESLSIEETNKLRLKLGLKPLEVNESEDNKPKVGSDTNPVFFKTENMSDKLEAQKIKERIEIQKNKRRVLEKLKRIKGLTQSDSEDEDAVNWVLKNRKLEEEKMRANQRERLLQEMDEEFGVSSLIEDDIKKKKEKAYSSKDLKGLSVGHKSDDFKEGHLMILTLKDKEVLNETEDVLENIDLVEHQKAIKNIENKTKRPEYRPYDEPEFDEFGILQTKSLLSKYDEEIDGPKKDSFKLGFNAVDKQKEIEMIRMKLNQEKGRISLIAPKPQIANEYYTEEEMIKFKKPKKNRTKKVLRKHNPILDTNDMEVYSNTSNSDYGSRKGKNSEQENNIKQESIEGENDIKQKNVKKRTPLPLDSISTDETFGSMNIDLSDVVLEEDEADKELQTALHKARKLKSRDNLEATTGAASIAKVAQIVKSFNNENEDSNESETNISNNIILNTTAEFCRNLGDIPTYGLAGNRDNEQQLIEMDEDVDEEKVNDSEPTKGHWNEVDVKDEDMTSDFDDNEGQPILEEEPDVSKGLAGALQLAMKKGYLDKEVKKQVSASRQSALQAQSYTIEEKFYEDDKIGRRERYSGPVSEFREKHDYKPDIKLDYVDEKGRVLDQKEAFRYLSHKFHGKGPSKNKIDKRMKKKEQEGKLRQMSSTDTPLNTLKMLTDKQKELQTPYIVLTGQKTSLQTTISKTK